MFFSVIMPLYNKEAHIKRAVDSVLAQTIQSFELIVIDDGSTDTSADIIKNYSDKRIKIYQQKNMGSCGARNEGIKKAKADYIAFLDADDEWLPNFLETITHLIKRYPEAGAYATGLKRIGVKGQTIKRKIKGIPDKNWEGLISNILEMMSYGPLPISGSSSCFPKKVFSEIGYFPTSVNRYGDADLWLRILFHYDLAYTANICAIYYRNVENSISNTNYSDKIDIEQTLETALYSGLIKPSQQPVCVNIISLFTYRNAIRFLVNNKLKEARNCAKKIRSKRIDLQIKKHFIMILSFMPFSIINFIYRFSNIKKTNQ